MLRSTNRLAAGQLVSRTFSGTRIGKLAFGGTTCIIIGFTLATHYGINEYFGCVVETRYHLRDVANINTLTARPTFRIPITAITPSRLATFGIKREAAAGVPTKTGFGFV